MRQCDSAGENRIISGHVRLRIVRAMLELDVESRTKLFEVKTIPIHPDLITNPASLLRCGLPRAGQLPSSCSSCMSTDGHQSSQREAECDPRLSSPTMSLENRLHGASASKEKQERPRSRTPHRRTAAPPHRRTKADIRQGGNDALAQDDQRDRCRAWRRDARFATGGAARPVGLPARSQLTPAAWAKGSSVAGSPPFQRQKPRLHHVGRVPLVLRRMGFRLLLTATSIRPCRSRGSACPVGRPEVKIAIVIG